MSENNLKLNREKCEFRKTKISYCGHVITNEGLQPDEEKVRAVKTMKKPENVKELMTFLGFINYLGKFIQNLSDKTAPLRKLLENDIHWYWGKEQDDAFETLKHAVSTTPVLKFYDVNQPVTLNVDASSMGLGAVILQNNQPVAYASRALTTAQQNYAQIEKEALAIKFGCTKFHQYLFGKEVLVETDHRPLQAIFAKPLYQAPARLQRILLSLQRYDLKVTYKPGKEMFISDCLSRAYLNETEEDLDSQELTINLLTYLPVSKEKREQFQRETANDPEMKELNKLVAHGWPEKQTLLSPDMQPYWSFRDEITSVEGMLFKGHKLIVPKSVRPEMLNLIHEGHLGIVKSKSRARETLFWPGMPGEIEQKVSQCEICAQYQNKNAKEPLIKTEIPSRPWEKISVDLFQFQGNNYLLTIDRFSSWPEIAKLDNLSSGNTITYMKSQFSRYGIPDEVYSDNGVQFTAHSFQQFRKEYGFKHVTSSPTYSQSNGLVERGVQTVKNLLKKSKDPYKSLMNYRDTTIESVGLSPAQMFLGRRLKTALPVTTPLLKPQKYDSSVVQNKRGKAQNKQKQYFDQHSGKSLSKLKPGDQVVMKRDHTETWEPATVVTQHESPRSYVVQQNNGHKFRRNRKHLRPTAAKFTSFKTIEDFDHHLELTSSVKTPQTEHSVDPPSREPRHSVSVSPPNSMNTPTTTRSGRTVKLPTKFGDYEL